MTDVDGAARDPQAAYHANGLGTQNVALAAARAGAALVYISTNEVFDGEPKARPIPSSTRPNPLNPYAALQAGRRVVRPPSHPPAFLSSAPPG